MKEIEVKLPAGPHELRIRHFKSMALVPDDGFGSANDRLSFLADFLGLRRNQVLDFTVKDVNRMTELAVRALAQMDLKAKIPDQIVLRGQKFNRVDPDLIGIGWHIDVGSCDINEDPVRLACLFYVPEGFNYSDVDENGNITHPIASRYDLFAEEFPLDLFIRSANFFLKRSLTSIKRSMAVEIATSKAKNKMLILLKSLNLLNGSRQLRR